MIPIPKRDKFLASRGGVVRFYKITCRRCAAMLCWYQKDGFGSLRRLYQDRLIPPAAPKGLPTILLGDRAQESVPNQAEWGQNHSGETVVCGGCGTLLGLWYLYPREQRPAIALFQDAIAKRPISLLFNASALLRYGIWGWRRKTL